MMTLFAPSVLWALIVGAIHEHGMIALFEAKTGRGDARKARKHTQSLILDTQALTAHTQHAC